jgi:hypothetical protein
VMKYTGIYIHDLRNVVSSLIMSRKRGEKIKGTDSLTQRPRYALEATKQIKRPLVRSQRGESLSTSETSAAACKARSCSSAAAARSHHHKAAATGKP